MALHSGVKMGRSILNTLLLRRHPTSSSSAEEDFLDLSLRNVRSIEALVNGGYLLNEKQCLDLSSKLLKTVLNIQELLYHCGAFTNLFRPALENLYRILEKAKLLLTKCCKDDWIAEAVFQIENDKDFQVILFEVGLCYHVIYEEAKSCMNEVKWSFQHEDLRNSFVFSPAPISDVHKDQEALKWRLEDIVSSEESGPNQSSQHPSLPSKLELEQCLARYLLAKWECVCQHPQTNELHISSAILWQKETELLGTWGSDRYLGCGASGGVCSSKWLGIPCAKKVFHGEVDESLFLKEAGISFHLNHPNVVNFLCCGNGQEKGDCFIAMELMEMSLADLISRQKKPFSYLMAVDIIMQIARGMCYLHAMGLAHRDLKPQNVVVRRLASPHLADQYCVKLVDFGLSKTKVEASKSNTMSGFGIGTTRYRAPEVNQKAHLNGGTRKAIWFKADVYSFAITSAEILSLQQPFGNTKMSKLFDELMHGLRPEIPAACPGDLVALLKDCWATHPRSRPNFASICTRLEGVRHDLLRVSPTPNQGLQEVGSDSTRYQFIRMKVEEYVVTQRQHFVVTNEAIELNLTLDSVSTHDMENMDSGACEHEEMNTTSSASTIDGSSFHSALGYSSLSSINEVSVSRSTELMSTLESSDCFPEHIEPMKRSRSQLSNNVELEIEVTGPKSPNTTQIEKEDHKAEQRRGRKRSEVELRRENGLIQQEEELQDSLVQCIMQDIGFDNDRPIAAYVIYKSLLQWRSFDAEKPTVFDKIIQAIHNVIEVPSEMKKLDVYKGHHQTRFDITVSVPRQSQEDNRALAYWLFNTSTLLLLLKRVSKDTTSKAAEGTPRQRWRSNSMTLLERITQGNGASWPQPSVVSFGNGRRITGGLDFAQPVESMYPGLLFKQQLTAYVGKIYVMVRDNLTREISTELGLIIRAPRATRDSQGEQKLNNHWHSIISSLSSMLSTLRANHVIPFLVCKLFTQSFSLINEQLFNSLLLRRTCCSFSHGEYLKVGLAGFEQWIHEAGEEYAGASWDELKHIRQAVEFLVVHQKPRKSLEDITCNLCPVLSVRQICRISCLYRDDKYGTCSISSKVISEMRSMILKNDDSIDVGSIKSSFLLKHDLSIPFSADDIVSLKSYLRLTFFPFHAC